MHGTLNIDKNKKLITQFASKSRDKSFKPSFQIKMELNKAFVK